MTDGEVFCAVALVCVFVCLAPAVDRVGSFEQRVFERFVREEGRHDVRGTDGDFYRCLGTVVGR